MMKTIYSSETSALTRVTRRHIPEDSIALNTFQSVDERPISVLETLSLVEAPEGADYIMRRRTK
jgi:hypothetical protein